MARFFKASSLTALFICGSLSIASTQALSATVNVSKNLIVNEVNDKAIEHAFIDKTSSFKLSQGDHALIVQYKDVFEDLDFAEERTVQSQEFVVKFTITNQKQLKLSTIKVKNLAAADKFVKSPKLTLKDGRGNPLELSLEKVSDYKLAKQVDLAVNTISTQQVLQSNNPTLAVTSSAINAKANNSLAQVNALTMLKYWWQNASKEQKQRFKKLTNAN